MRWLGLLLLWTAACSDTTTELVGAPADAGSTADGSGCAIATCAGKVFECGNCIDDDSDGVLDSEDPECLGACDNSEDGYFPRLPGDPGAPCRADCFWDVGNGAGNDQCLWDHRCDPLETAPDFPPEGPTCSYDPSVKLGGNTSCDDALASQPVACRESCLPLTPNGCDCFGCCVFSGAPTPVWIGKEGCTSEFVGDPTKCPPCTLVSGCSNACDDCEVCVDKGVPSSSCTPAEQCPDGAAACGVPGLLSCTQGSYCITGCCVVVPA